MAPKAALEIVLGWPTETGCHELLPKKVAYKWRLAGTFLVSEPIFWFPIFEGSAFELPLNLHLDWLTFG